MQLIAALAVVTEDWPPYAIALHAWTYSAPTALGLFWLQIGGNTMGRWLRVPFMLALLVMAPVCAAQVLWGATEYGMSVEQVKTVLPAAIATEKGSTLKGGAVELLRVENIELASRPFVAKLFFQGGNLSQVTLSPAQQESFTAALSVFNSLADALTSKYGAALSREVIRQPLNQGKATWISGRTNITLYVLAINDQGPAVLTISYQVRVAGDADKL